MISEPYKRLTTILTEIQYQCWGPTTTLERQGTRSGKRTDKARQDQLDEQEANKKAEAAARRYKRDCAKKLREADERAAALELEAADRAEQTPPNNLYTLLGGGG